MKTIKKIFNSFKIQQSVYLMMISVKTVRKSFFKSMLCYSCCKAKEKFLTRFQLKLTKKTVLTLVNFNIWNNTTHSWYRRKTGYSRTTYKLKNNKNNFHKKTLFRNNIVHEFLLIFNFFFIHKKLFIFRSL